MLISLTADKIQQLIDIGSRGLSFPLSPLLTCYRMVETLKHNNLLTDEEYNACIEDVNRLNSVVTEFRRYQDLKRYQEHYGNGEKE